MSALGQKRTHAVQQAMSAKGQKRTVKKYDVDTRPLAPFRVGAVRNKSIRSKKRAALAERLLVRETSILVV